MKVTIRLQDGPYIAEMESVADCDPMAPFTAIEDLGVKVSELWDEIYCGDKRVSNQRNQSEEG